MKRLNIMALMFVLTCTACAPYSYMTINLLSDDFVSYTVILVPNLTDDRLDVLTGPQGWDSAGKQNGWIGFERGKNGTITFTMDELPSRSVCTDIASTSATWVISEILLTKTGNPDTQKGSNFGNQQRGWIEHAFPQMEYKTGEIKDPALGSISVVVQNLNNNNGRRDAYYQVTAKRCSDGKELSTDPGVGNGGKK